VQNKQEDEYQDLAGALGARALPRRDKAETAAAHPANCKKAGAQISIRSLRDLKKLRRALKRLKRPLGTRLPIQDARVSVAIEGQPENMCSL
jgi:hypothetical protein